MGKSNFDQQQKLSTLKSAEENGVKFAAEVAGVHYATVYEWRRQREALGEEAFLAYESHHPGRGVKEITPEQEKAVKDVRAENPGYGPGQVRSQLRRQGVTISLRTIRKIMQADGYKPLKSEKNKQAVNRFEASRPLELAQMDILELYVNKAKVYLFVLIDDFSRFILGVRLVEQTSADEVIALVSEAVNRYGKMEELLTDRGFVFYSWRGINRFEKYLENEGIDHTHARPHHPQTQGKVEALNKRIRSELFVQQHFCSIEQAQKALQDWVEHYNTKRPHQGIGGFLVPAERFQGREKEILTRLAQGLDVTQDSTEIERSIINLVLGPDGRLTLFVLGRQLELKGVSHGGDIEQRRSSSADSGEKNTESQGPS